MFYPKWMLASSLVFQQQQQNVESRLAFRVHETRDLQFQASVASQFIQSYQNKMKFASYFNQHQIKGAQLLSPTNPIITMSKA